MYIICLHVEHDPYPATVTLIHQVLQVTLRPKVGVYLVYILLPVAMVAVVSLSGNGRDPDGVGSQTLDVIEFLGDA